MSRVRRVVVHDRIEPALEAGTYTVRVQQTVTAAGPCGSAPGTIPDDARYVEVTAPRFVLPSTEILSTFPPANADGPFTTRLPQIVLRRRTLPWERAAGDDRPWLALVVLTDNEATLLPSVPVADAVTPGVRLTGTNPDGPTCAALEVTSRVVNEVFPSREDLRYCCHVRQVPIDDTELAQGDEDGWVAVVLATRLPRPGLRYRACLVSLEGQWHELPVNPPTETGIRKLRVYDHLSDAVISRARGTRQDGVRLRTTTAEVPALSPKAVRAPTVERADAAPVTGAAFQPADAWTGAADLLRAEPGDVRVAYVADFARRGMVALDVDLSVLDPGRRRLRFPVLASWEFRCEGDKDFQYLASHLHVGLLGTTERPNRGPADRVPEVADTGHVVLPATTRAGEARPVWYRGPLVPRAVDRRPARAVHVADALRRIAEEGRFEVGEAAAFEVGRLLALSAPATVAALRDWRARGFARERARRFVVASTLATLADEFMHLAGETAAGGVLARALERGLVRTVGAVDVLDEVVPRVNPVDPLPELDLLADPAATVAAGTGLRVGEVREAFAGVTRPALRADAIAPVATATFEELRARPELLAPVTQRLTHTVAGLRDLAEGDIR